MFGETVSLLKEEGKEGRQERQRRRQRGRETGRKKEEHKAFSLCKSQNF